MRRTFAFASMMFVPALALGLCACSREKTYPVTVEAAQAALEDSKIPDAAFGSEIYSGTATAIPGGVEWPIGLDQSGSKGSGSGANPKYVMILAARFIPAAGGIKVAVDLKPPSSGEAEAFAKRMAGRPAVATMYRTITSEQVDAALSHRDFDLANIRQSKALASLAMFPQVNDDMDREVEEFHRREREREARGGSSTQDSGIAPMSSDNPSQ